MRRTMRNAALVAALSGLGGYNVSAQVAEWPTERPPRPLAARDVKFPPYQMRTLGNGLQVIAVSHHEQPAVSLRLLIRAGGSQDPVVKPGVAALAAALLDQGTTSRSAEQIATTIDSIGGAVGAGSGSDLTFVQSVVMKDSMDLALDLVSDLARNPAFAQDEIDRQKQQILSGLKVSYEDPDYIAGVVFDRLVYGFHPYGRPDSGTPQSILSITRDDLVSFHKTWFGANNAILAIVGDVTPEEAFAGAERAFGQWAKAQSAAPKIEEPPAPTRRLILIDRPGAVQTEIRVGNAALPRKHPDFLALDLAMKILGGEGGNRLHRVLRSERGLTYGASADVHAQKDAGDLVADTDTRSETTGEVLRLIVDEMWKLQRQRVQQRELADAQAYLTGSFPLTIETPSAIALQILNAVFYGLDLSELETLRERVNAVTPEDIQRVAQQYLRPDRLSIVLVGDASVFSKQLAAVGFDQFDRIPIAELDLSSSTLRRQAIPAHRLERVSFSTVPASASGWKEAPRVLTSAQETVGNQGIGQLISEAVQAKGGLEKLRSVKTVKATSTTWIDGPGGRIAVPTTTWIRYPDAFRVDADMPTGLVSQVLVGDTFFVNDARGPRQASPVAATEMRGSAQRDAVRLLLLLTEGPPAVKRISIDVAGKQMPGLVLAAAERPSITLVFDPSSGLIARQRYTIDTPDGPRTAEEEFSDYRDVDGLKVAFRAVVQRQGAPRVERILKNFEYNIPIDASVFARP
jgi:zinc protease